MTFDTEAQKAGRQPLQVVELDLDTCAETFSVAPCTATLGAVGKCYNTRASCQDPTNYNRTTKTYRFCEPQEGLPAGEAMIPSIVSVKRTPARITPGKGLGYRATITVILQDHPHHDRGVDPYFSDRSGDASARGSYWRKLKARNLHYENRVLRLRTGYLATPFSWAHFDDREYFIDRIEGPDKSGRVKIVAKDVLKLADDDRAVAPAPSEGALAADITASATSLTVTTGTGADYPAPDYVRIGSEIIYYAARSGDTLQTLTRGAAGTTASAHDQDDLVQLCASWSATNVRDIIDELLTTFAGIPSSYINATDWNAEETSWLSAYSISAIISEPTGVTKLLDELCEQCQVMLWWDDRAQQIRLKAVVPPLGNLGTELVEADKALADSVSVKDATDLRVTQVWFYYDPDDYTETATKNYKKLYIQADLDAEGADQYGDQRIVVIKSRWFNEANDAAVNQSAGRIFNSRAKSPKRITLSVDAKDLADYCLGDVIDLVSDQVVDFDGNPKTLRGVLTEEKETKAGTTVQFQFLSGVGLGRLGFIGPNTLVDYSSETQANRDQYCFVGPATGNFADGGEPYKII